MRIKKFFKMLTSLKNPAMKPYLQNCINSGGVAGL